MVVFQPTSETNTNPPLGIWGERVYESKPALPHQGLKNFLTRNNAYFQKTQGGACEAREFESHQQLPWWLHVHAHQQIPEGLACWLTSWFCRDLTFLEILGRWFPADKSFLMVADSGQSELASSRSGLDWIEAVFRSRSLDDLRFHVHTLVWGIPTQSQRGSPRRIQDERLTGGDRSKFRNLCPYPMHPISRLQALGIWLQ